MTLALRNLRLEDIDSVLEWALDQEFCEANDWAFPSDPERLRSH
jgi:hypothetical protein